MLLSPFANRVVDEPCPAVGYLIQRRPEQTFQSGFGMVKPDRLPDVDARWDGRCLDDFGKRARSLMRMTGEGIGASALGSTDQ